MVKVKITSDIANILENATEVEEFNKALGSYETDGSFLYIPKNRLKTMQQKANPIKRVMAAFQA